MGKGRRVPIQLQQQDEEEYDDWEEAEDEDTLGERVTINTKFLGTVLSGIGATNRRKVDTNAAAASTLVSDEESVYTTSPIVFDQRMLQGLCCCVSCHRRWAVKELQA